MNNQRLFSSLTAFIVACGLVPAAAEADGVLRQYYISAEEVDWDFAPLGRDEMMGMECQRQSKREPKGSAKCCHFGVSKIAAPTCASIRATALVT